MADYLSRHPSPSNNHHKIKAKELRNNWFTVDKIIVNNSDLWRRAIGEINQSQARWRSRANWQSAAQTLGSRTFSHSYKRTNSH